MINVYYDFHKEKLGSIRRPGTRRVYSQINAALTMDWMRPPVLIFCGGQP